MKVGELESALFERFPREDAEAWDHVGLSVGDPAAEVTGVACALDATEATVREAVRVGANVLLTHHPVYISAPDTFAPAAPERASSAAAVYEAIRAGVSIISMHTNLDRSHEARVALPALMSLEPMSSLEHTREPERTGLGSLCACEPVSLRALASHAAEVFGSQPRVWGDPDTYVARVAFLGGSMGDFGELALAAGADAIVTGECGYHVALDISARGLSVVLLGHDRSEEPFCRVLADVAVDAGVPANLVQIVPVPSQWWTVL